MNLDALAELHRLDRARLRMSRVSNILQWDQETYLPPEAVEGRADQLADIEGVAHQRAVDPRIGTLLESLGSTSSAPAGDGSLPALERDFLRVLRHDYDRATKLPQDLVEEMARDAGLSQAAWVAARKADDFASFSPHLRKMVSHARRKAQCWGFVQNPYDGLLDQHEPGMTEGRIASLFDPLAERLRSLLKRISAAPAPEASVLGREFPVSDQADEGRAIMEDLRFDLGRGRLDLSAHPFTTTLGDQDVRITTRYFPRNMASGFFSVVHETGHALYELGFPQELRGSCLADGASMGIHESQSRLWENVIGRSRAFWLGRFPRLAQRYRGILDDVDAESFYRAINAVKPSLIRVDADEVTYSLHVILRFNLERRLFSGDLEVDDLPAAWRAGMRELLGVEPDTDADGVLQDVHWSMGAFGYFPSYALGNLYGLQFWSTLVQDLPDIEELLRRGDFSRPLDWLRDRVHRLGRRRTPEELIQEVSGRPLSADFFVDYLERKYADLYRL